MAFHDAGKASYCTILLLKDHHHRHDRFFWGGAVDFFLLNITGLSVAWQGSAGGGAPELEGFSG